MKFLCFSFVNIVQVAILVSLAVVNAAIRPGSPVAPTFGQDNVAQIVRSESVVNPDSFQYAYETSNGIHSQASGQLKQIGTESAVVHNGDYGYTAPDGQVIGINYVADENGYQPTVSFFLSFYFNIFLIF